MAWYRALPNPKPSEATKRLQGARCMYVSPEGIRGLYCDNNALPFAGKGIATATRRKKKARWAMQRRKNQDARRDVNNMLRGKAFGADVGLYHTKLNAISLSTV